ncbi:MAG TPA: dynamin family protein, partial [Cyanobacteria bacterium UBA11368]|nr:dynamin family protein [Cyanobacteria bacterium UBA11368]
QIKTNLYHELNKILEEVKKEAKVSVETYFTESEDQRADLLKKGSIKANQFLNWVSNKFKSPLDLKRQATLEFDTLSEAEEFADLAVAYAKKRADVLLEGIRENTRKQIDAARQGMIDFLDEQTKPIVERARERLNENFQLTLSLPTPRLEFEEIDFNKPRVLRHTRSVDQGYEEVVRTKRSFAHFLWLVPFEVKEQIRRPNRRENFYTVSLHGIVYEVNKLIEQNINNLKQDINQYLDEDFQQRIDIFFNDLDRYLSNYRNSLRQAQADQKLSIEGKEKLKKGLNSLIPQVNEQIAQANSYLEHTEELMSKLSG